MPVRLSHLAQDRRTCTLRVGDETVTITYRPGGVTPELEDQLREYTADQRGGAAMVALLAHCLVEWDVLDEDGEPLAPTAENLRRLPTVFLVRVAQAITDDLRPNLQSAGASGAGS
ncbi:MAG: hypothetical protein IRY83_04110 [Chloroflexi bacterium]|nr:hypothetical protein [Chloroflexota bacterium]